MGTAPVTGREKRDNPAAKAALKKEWDRLRDIPTWDESGVREWSDIRKEAKDSGKDANIGSVFDICVEKNAELKDGDPKRKFKGRVVFAGDRVFDHEV